MPLGTNSMHLHYTCVESTVRGAGRVGMLSVLICVTGVTHILIQNDGKGTPREKGHPDPEPLLSGSLVETLPSACAWGSIQVPFALERAKPYSPCSSA